MKRVLIVSSSFTPAMPASVHRARLLGWTLPNVGWDAEVLTPGVQFQRPEWLDADSSSFFPLHLPCHEVPPPKRDFIQRLGCRGMAWRALLPIFRRGCELLATGRFDLVYITTTVFNFFCLGRRWWRRFGLPYVLDFHDPWYRPSTGDFSTTSHRYKAWVSNRLARYLEAYAVGGAGGLVAVSPNYLTELRVRYPQAPVFRNASTEAIPFGVLTRDFDLVRLAADGQDGNVFEIAYVGVGAEIMAKSFRRIADGLARLRRREPAVFNGLRIRLSGTDGRWSEGKPKILQEQAVGAGVGDLVEEAPRIIPYREATRRAVAADGLLVLGVDDPAYMPSKLFLYALTGKPLLACMHFCSQVNNYFARMPGLGTLIHFGAREADEAVEDEKILKFLRQVRARQPLMHGDVGIEFSAGAMARRHANLFDKIIAAKHPL